MSLTRQMPQTAAVTEAAEAIRLVEFAHLLPAVALSDRIRVRVAADCSSAADESGWRAADDAECDWLLDVNGRQEGAEGADPEGAARPLLQIFSAPRTLCRRFQTLVESLVEGVAEPPERAAVIDSFVDFANFIEAPLAGNHSIGLKFITAGGGDGVEKALLPMAHLNVGNDVIELASVAVMMQDLGSREFRIALDPAEGVFVSRAAPGWRLRASGEVASPVLSVLG